MCPYKSVTHVPGCTRELQDLDQCLDVPVASFDRRVQQLLREFRKKKLGIRFPLPAADSGIGAKIAWPGQFAAELRQLPRLDRSEEFRMARRHEFLQQRVVAAGENSDALSQASADLLAHRNLFVEGTLYLVTACARRYRGLGVDLADLIQEGNASLFQAIEGFDWRRDVRFKTYAQYWIHQAILKTLYNCSRTVRIPIWVQKTLRKVQRLQQASKEVPSPSSIAAKLNIPESRLRDLLNTKRYAVSIDATMPGDTEGSSMAGRLVDSRLLPVPESIQDSDLGERLQDLLNELSEREQQILIRRYGMHGQGSETLSEIAVDLGITAERVRQLQSAALLRLQRSSAKDALAEFLS